jgi:hypothetical protein
MARRRVTDAYPRIAFRKKSLSWWAQLTRVPPECEHVEFEHAWTALYAPDTVYLRGKPRAVRTPARAEVSLCLDCLFGELRPELSQFAGRVLAFEPDGQNFSEYFFLAPEDFDAAGLKPEVGRAIRARVERIAGPCEQSSCENAASWLWLPRAEIESLDDVQAIAAAKGKPYCAGHGSAALCTALGSIEQVNLFYMNLPYGHSGAYLWI